MDLKDVGTQLLFTTVPVWVEYLDGKQGSGTGFIFTLPVEGKPKESIPFLITNYHVVKEIKRGVVEFAEKRDEKPVRAKKIRVEFDGTAFGRFISEKDDLAAVPIGPLLNQMGQEGKPIFYRSIGKEIIPENEMIQNLSAIEEITFIGYPSGLYDEHNAMPIIRRGITATPVWSDYQGEEVFLIDAGVYPGSSGSPVFLYNQGLYSTTRTNFAVGSRVLFLGVLTQAIIRVEGDKPHVFLGLGKVIKSKRLQDFVENAAKRAG